MKFTHRLANRGKGQKHFYDTNYFQVTLISLFSISRQIFVWSQFYSMFCSAQQCMQTLQNSPSADAAVFSGADWTICSVKWSICSGWLQSCVQMCAHQLSVLQHFQTPHQPQPLGQATNLQNLRLASTAQHSQCVWG